VARLAGANKVVVVAVQKAPRFDKTLRHLVHKCLRVFAGLARGVGDLLRVLVGSGQEERIVAAQFAIAFGRVGQQRGRGRPDVRRAVDVIDGRGDVVAFVVRFEVRHDRLLSYRVRAKDKAPTPVNSAGALR
jgi:hypothetical protein